MALLINELIQAELYYQRALEIYVNKFGANDPSVIKTKSNLVFGFFVLLVGFLNLLALH